MLRQTLLVLAIALSVAACSKGPQGGAGKKTDAAAEQPVLITAEDLITLHSGDLASGPVITGSVQPERRADLRAEVSAVVLQVLKETGESVKAAQRRIEELLQKQNELMTKAKQSQFRAAPVTEKDKPDPARTGADRKQ